MTEINDEYCRTSLKLSRQDIKIYLGMKEYTELMKHFWAYRYNDGSTEVHVNKCTLFPNEFFKTLRKTGNMWEAKSIGLTVVMEEIQKMRGELE